MDFNTWLTASGFDPETVTPAQKTKLQAAWRAETDPPKQKDEPTPEKVKVDSGGFDATMKAIEDENARIAYIREATIAACKANIGNQDKQEQFRKACESAIESKTPVHEFKLAMMRMDRYAGNLEVSSGAPSINDDVITAAVCKAGGLETLEKEFDQRTLEAVDKNFRHGLGLQDLIGHFARKNGFRGHSIKAALNTPEVLKAAFGASPNGSAPELYAGTTGPSTYSLPNILGTIANKFLKVGFLAIDDAWRSFVAVSSVPDFKLKTTAALTGGFVYKPLAPGGEIQHGDVSEKAYTNQAATQARMFGIDRRDLINDDLNALTGVSRRLGRGAALRINELVYTVFLNNTSFFTAGNNNVITGGTSVLSGSTGLEALRLADVAFRLQTDPDGLPLGVFPKILLVPSALRISALNLMNSTTIVGSTTANSMVPDQNSFAGAYNVVSSPYLQNSAYTGFSATAWYLLADPNDMPTIEIVFLNGQEMPTVETADADFNQLGIALRGFFDGGCALQEFRGGLRAAGA